MLHNGWNKPSLCWDVSALIAFLITLTTHWNCEPLSQVSVNVTPQINNIMF